MATWTEDDLVRRVMFLRERFGVPLRLATKDEGSGEECDPRRWVMHRDVAIEGPDGVSTIPQPISAPLTIPKMVQWMEGYEAGAVAMTPFGALA